MKKFILKRGEEVLGEFDDIIAGRGFMRYFEHCRLIRSEDGAVVSIKKGHYDPQTPIVRLRDLSAPMGR